MGSALQELSSHQLFHQYQTRTIEIRRTGQHRHGTYFAHGNRPTTQTRKLIRWSVKSPRFVDVGASLQVNGAHTPSIHLLCIYYYCHAVKLSTQRTRRASFDLMLIRHPCKLSANSLLSAAIYVRTCTYVPWVFSRVQVREEVDHGHHVLGHRVRHERRVPLELDHHSAGGATRGQAVGQAKIAEQLES